MLFLLGVYILINSQFYIIKRKPKIPMSHILLHTHYVTICSYHVMYTFQSESTLYSSLNVKELFARNKREI